MGLNISSGRIYVDDGAGTVKFDTDDELFVPTNYVTGTKVIPAVSGSFTNDGINPPSYLSTHQTDDYLISSVNSSATVVRGPVSVTTSSGYTVNNSKAGDGVAGVVDLGYFQAGGTYMHARLPTLWIHPSGNRYARKWANYEALTFYVSSGQLRLYREAFVVGDYDFTGTTPPQSSTVTIYETTLTYRLLVGTFV